MDGDRAAAPDPLALVHTRLHRAEGQIRTHGQMLGRHALEIDAIRQGQAEQAQVGRETIIVLHRLDETVAAHSRTNEALTNALVILTSRMDTEVRTREAQDQEIASQLTATRRGWPRLVGGALLALFFGVVGIGLWLWGQINHGVHELSGIIIHHLWFAAPP